MIEGSLYISRLLIKKRWEVVIGMQLFKIDTNKKSLEKIMGSTLSSWGLNEPCDLESWIINYNKDIFGWLFFHTGG